MDDENTKSETIRVRLDHYQNAFIENVLREGKKSNPRLTKSQVVRNIINAFETLMTTPLVALLKQLPQESSLKEIKKDD